MSSLRAAWVRSVGLLREEHVFSSMVPSCEGSARLWKKMENDCSVSVMPDHGPQRYERGASDTRKP